MANDGAAPRTVTVMVDAHSELLSTYQVRERAGPAGAATS
jgi:hypothetical protein